MLLRAPFPDNERAAPNLMNGGRHAREDGPAGLEVVTLERAVCRSSPVAADTSHDPEAEGFGGITKWLRYQKNSFVLHESSASCLWYNVVASLQYLCTGDTCGFK